MDKCADDLVEVEHVVAPLTPKSVRQQKRLARKLARAADLYKLAGLGLLAARCWRYSASIYDKLSDETLRQHMLELADAVPDQAF
jgi:hypothetical protein